MSESAAAAPGPPGAAGDPGSGPDLEILSKHILNATQLLLDAGDVESLKSLVQEKTDLLKKFASDPSCRALMVERVVRGDGDEEEEISWNLSTDVRYSNNKATGAIFIKKLAAIETDKPLPSQMRIITLSEDSPYETLHSYLSCAVSPFFKSYLRESTKTSDSRDLSGDKMAPSVEKKLVELEMGLLHLQQNVDIPEIQLMPHPSVQHIIRTCSEQGRRARVQDMGSKVEDSTYLNTLQNLVNRWIKEIQKVTRMERDPSVGTALQEVSFWLNLERALLNIQEMRDSSEVQLTLDILKHGKRFHATVSFDTDTGLKQALAKVNDYSPLMKDFPLDELFAATEVEKIRAAVHSIFSHLKKIRSCQEYPVQRALRLIEAISRDLLEQMNKVLSTRRLMHIQNEEFEKVQFQCFEVFSAWDEQYETLQGTLRDIAKKKREEPLKVSWRVNPAHKLLQTRIDQMRKFRRQHEQLRSVISRVLRATEEEGPAIGEIDQAYEVVKEVDCLDTSKEGVESWEAAIARYDEKIDRVESRITSRLRDQLGQAKSAAEMFRIFSRFNALFVRPHIRGAIREYQNQLIHRVKEDIEKLHEKFKVQYQDSRASVLSLGRDIPPVSGSIIWARQIERQLETYLRRVEDVLGKGWQEHVEGQKLKEDGDAFKMQLDTKAVFDGWVSRVNQRNFAVSGPIFLLEQIRSEVEDTVRKLRLRINFQQEIITLSKEVRNLKWLGYRVPLTIINKAHQANQLYPFAVSLTESVNTYGAVCSRVDQRPQLKTLLAERRNELIRLVHEGAELVWDSYKLESYTQRFQDHVFTYQEKVDDLICLDDTISREVKQLADCPFEANQFKQILEKVQKSVDEMAHHSYSNLTIWVSTLDQIIEQILANRLEEAINAWSDKLEGKAKESEDDEDEEEEKKSKPKPKPMVKSISLEMRLTNQVLFCHPPTQSVYQNLVRQLQEWQNIILRLPRIQAQRYQVGLSIKQNDIDLHYRSVMSQLPAGNVTMDRAYKAIASINKNVDDYVKQWLHYQFLWDMQSSAIYEAMGSDIGMWQAMLVDVRKRRQTFDTSEFLFKTGPVTVEFGKVQSKVSLKYDAWHKEMLASFGSMMSDQMTTFHSEISRARNELENSSVESAHTADAVQVITQVQKLKRQMKQWENQVDQYREGQKLLEKQRFQFPSQWLYIDNIDGEWSAFQDIHKRKDTAIQEKVATLQMRIVSEDKVVEEKTSNLLSDWERGKPVAPSIKPADALNSLTIFESKFKKIEEDRENQRQAKEALELSDTSGSSAVSERLQVALEEMGDLKEIWSELGKITQQMEQMKSQSWQVIQPRKLRQSLDGLRDQMKNFPARLRQYASYEHVMNKLKSLIKSNWIVVELKSSTVKERHWKQLIKKLKLNWNLNDLILGDIWDLDLNRYEPIFKEVLTVAQGEMALEQYLNQVKEAWQNYEVDLINYQNKCKLIRGWDDLFTKLKDHINSVSQMKLSPYYKVFEDEASSWDEKLNRMNVIFDLWIDVQRRWVYLEGIFTGSADLPHLLPQETQRFQSISSEFLGLMKKVARAPLVLDIITIPGVQRNLERLGDLLAKIQKALGEYLERERSAFPRFYFVGDEDLLEIIGNSKAIGKLQKHFKKMFAGVHGLILSEDEKVIKGVVSKEGEELMYSVPVDTNKFPKINEWLGLVEKQMKESLAKNLNVAYQEFKNLSKEKLTQETFFNWLDKYQSQLIVVSSQINWTAQVEAAIQKNDLDGCLSFIDEQLNILADSVLQEQPAIRRKKLEHLIMECVYQRGTVRELKALGVQDIKDFNWLMQMRFYYDNAEKDCLKQLCIKMANAEFFYGFEYLGITDKLVQTPLTTRCWLTMTQALDSRLGGSPFGPAGTGKTESVKALGNALGRFTLVFNCDETFDFQAMGRIFIGLCQVGAWGCFDEFNRLEERILSAVSQQIQSIQEALKLTMQAAAAPKVQLLGRAVGVSKDMAMFITMNPGYAGRSNLPDNLKKLFRSLAMTKPDRKLIAQVLLYSQGFRSAETLSKKIVPFFELCHEQLSSQSHYDFGLRALKSVLASAGNVKRDKIAHLMKQAVERDENITEEEVAATLPEQEILIQAVSETMLPKLVADDIPLLHSLLSDVFPGIPYTRAEMTALKEKILTVCKTNHYVYGDPEDEQQAGSMWVEKVLQLCQIQNINHGLMMVGPSGSGKSSAWRTLLTALELLDGTEGVPYVIDPKAISKEELYGNLDPNTREWTDGLFTAILRRIVDNVRGEATKRHWIIFDGDVDPEWVENLNSVLDDNKLLTLPNGERLGIPPNLRIMFEVEHLKYATLATVSRCGMIWFSEDVLSTQMICRHFLDQLKNQPIDQVDGQLKEEEAEALSVQSQVACSIEEFFTEDGLVVKCLDYSFELEHIMEPAKLRMLDTLFSMLRQTVRSIVQYNQSHPDFPISSDIVEKYCQKFLIYSMVWCFSGDGKLSERNKMGEFIGRCTTIPLPPVGPKQSLIDFEPTLSTGDWVLWSSKVPQVEIETHRVTATDVVIPTLDTVRHEALLYTWLAEHKPICLCGPPGSGKTMTLFSALRALPDLEVVGLNFSSATTPELLLKTFEHYCEYRRTPNGLVMAPIQLQKWLVLFCDEINLPDTDNYGTQRVISFLRQIVERKGFYRSSDQQFVMLERIQIVGACNPPTDPGRKPMTNRFLRHVPVVYVDYPAPMSLTQIYGTFNRAMLRLVPDLRTYSDPLTSAMVDLYTQSQERFTQDMQPHYVYSPREMSRWVRGITEALKPLETLSVEGLVRIWAHEALRLFHDRLVYDEERAWTEAKIDEVALKHFPNIDRDGALQRPILYSNWLSKDYVPVDREELRDYVKARLKVFYEEELDVQLVLFNSVLDHVLRIDRIFRQPQGHLLLIGTSGSGKTTLSRFVAWMNGLSVFQVKVHRKYTGECFDEDLRNVLKRAGCKGEKIAFIMDESNVLDSSFLERMNTLLANGEVPGLFEGDELSQLMTLCKEGAAREGLMLDSQDELYRWFTGEVTKNLHVVFTMNPAEDGLAGAAATSPALFNRCVLNWFGDWNSEALYQVGYEFTNKLDLDRADYNSPGGLKLVSPDIGIDSQPNHRQVIVDSAVFIHKTLHAAVKSLQKRGDVTFTVTPRHFLDFIQQYTKMMNEKRSELEEQQIHLNVGLKRINETVTQVDELRKELAVKKTNLTEAENNANEKLKIMIKGQQDAEENKKKSTEIRARLEVQQKKCAEKKIEVEEDLSKVEPAVQDAKNAVKGIKKNNLQELKALNNPPGGVKLALESVLLLLGEKADDWKQIRQIIVKDHFIPSIVNFDSEAITDKARKIFKDKYLSNPDYNYEKINKASKACGPLVKWASAQLQYADMLKRVEPLRNELKALETETQKNVEESSAMDNLIADLEKQIEEYKRDYAELIRQAESIKNEMISVESKVSRSEGLLSNLGSERERWQETSEGFRNQMSTLAGDCLLSSAFVAYAGYFDQEMRSSLSQAWQDRLNEAEIEFRKSLNQSEYLSTVDKRMEWQNNKLPVDELCIENAIMLERYNRYPLIVDPSGQATEFIMKQYADKKIVSTSFLDDAFRKQLESCLRFGNPILVHDAESFDPILNPVLNREVRKSGGRVLITIGDQDIDLSPTFKIFLATRDTSHEFSPPLCSRVTLVNFTVTQSSLQSQCLSSVLRSERPDVDAKRTDMLKLQGEYQLRLRQLEKQLLSTLNDVKGRILDDDSVITALETLKKEAKEIGEKASETDKVMDEIARVSAIYEPLSQGCSALFFTLDSLSNINKLYQFSLNFFFDIFTNAIESGPGSASDKAERLEKIVRSLFEETYKRASRSLLHEDRICFLLLLAKIELEIFKNGACLNELNHFLHNQEILISPTEMANSGFSPAKFNEMQRENMIRLTRRLKHFAQLEQKVESQAASVEKWMNGGDELPDLFEMTNPDNESWISAQKLLVEQALRPSHVLPAVREFCTAVFGASFGGNELTCGEVMNQVKPAQPIMLASVAGTDASYIVDELARSLQKDMSSVAMGSPEGFDEAEKAISSASRTGRWVLLKNVHLAPSWLQQLEKKLHTLGPNQNFRLFLTAEISPKLPVNMLRTARILTYEPPPGIKASLTSTLANYENRMTVQPTERARIYFLLGWFHSIVQERMRYTPLGWSKTYELSDAELRSGMDTIDQWLEITGKGRSNINPENIPWKAMSTLLSQAIYGGKMDNPFDQRLLDSFLAKLFNPETFDSNFVLAQPEGQKALNVPDGTKVQIYKDWIQQLPQVQKPSFMGLPDNAETVLQTAKGRDLIRKVLLGQTKEQESAKKFFNMQLTLNLEGGADTFLRPAWMSSLLNQATAWKGQLPVEPKSLQFDPRDPLARYFAREIQSGIKLLRLVKKHLNELIDVCEGKTKQTNETRSLCDSLTKQLIPSQWRKYKYSPHFTAAQWINDFCARIQQLNTINVGDMEHQVVWLGGLFQPEAWLTATHQAAAKQLGLSLEDLELDLQWGRVKGGFHVKGISICGAKPVGDHGVEITSEIETESEVTSLVWKSSVEKRNIVLPVYRNSARQDLLFQVQINSTVDERHIYERGIAFITAQ